MNDITAIELKKVSTLPTEGFVDVKIILGDRKNNIPGILPISETTWFEGINKGIYPSGIKHGRRTIYPVNKIRELIERINSESVAA